MLSVPPVLLLMKELCQEVVLLSSMLPRDLTSSRELTLTKTLESRSSRMHAKSPPRPFARMLDLKDQLLSTSFWKLELETMDLMLARENMLT